MYIIVLLPIFKLNDRGFVINYRWVMPTIKITFIVGIICLEGKCEISQLEHYPCNCLRQLHFCLLL